MSDEEEVLNELVVVQNDEHEIDFEALLENGVELQAAVIENVAKAKDGGFQVLLSVSEMDAKGVGKLLSDTHTVYHVLLVPHDD